MKGNTLPYFLTISPTICQIKMKMKKMKKYEKTGWRIHSYKIE